MAIIIRQSTAIDVALGPFVDSADGDTVESGLTITQPDIRLSKNGAAFAQKSAAQTLSHMENGYFSLNLSTTDTNTVGALRVHCHESGALPVWADFQVVEESIYDALFAASSPAPATAADLATVDTVVDAIKVKTDQLTFGVTNEVNANITSVNEVAVTGDGAATPWGP